MACRGPAERNKTMKEKINLENISGGAGGASKYYCVEGYSETKKGNVKKYVSTYEDAVKLCGLLGMGTECIKEVTNTN
jgi:hypothetical protein